MLSLALFAAAATQPLPAVVVEVTPDKAIAELFDQGRWRATNSVWDGHVGRKTYWNMRVEYSLNKAGRVGFCDVVKSSGSNSFDQAACSAMREKVRMAPDLGADGKPKRSGRIFEAPQYFRQIRQMTFICGTGWDEMEEPAQ